MKVINLFAGPGAGKSTIAMGLTSLMKTKGMNAEYVTEYAKDLTWEKRFNALGDQLFVLANQNRKLTRLISQVEWVVTDSPLLLSEHYRTPAYLPLTFRSLLFELWHSYTNINFFIERKKQYRQVGRTQTKEEAELLDKSIKQMLDDNTIEYTEIAGDNKAAERIYDLLV